MPANRASAALFSLYDCKSQDISKRARWKEKLLSAGIHTLPKTPQKHQ